MFIIFGLLFISWSSNSYAWGGYDWDRNSFIEIEKGELVKEGEEITIFDYGSSEYKDVEIVSIERNGGNVEIEAVDSEDDEIRVFEMD